ncbi:hypothetical protein ACVCAH_30875 [Micromonospora sp. LZ34]
MAVRRHAARLATVCALLGGLVALGGSPALADDDQVRVRSAGSFTAGGSAEGVSMEVRRRKDGCVLLRTALGLRLPGVRPDQVTVQVNYGGRWFPVPLSGGGGSVASTTTSPANPRLCKGKSITVRYRVAFAAAAPSGRLTVAGEATSAMGQLLGRGAVASRVVGGRASASPTPSKKPSPTPSVAPTEEAVDDVSPVAALAAGGAASNAAEESSGGSLVMFFGIAMVAVGILLIVLLFRRSRADKEHVDDVPLLLGNPGGTTYRSGQGPAAAPVRPGPVYGQQPPATGGVYGGMPAPRPAGGVYGGRPTAPPEATQVMPGRHAAPAPPVSGPPAPPVSGPPHPPAPPVSGPPHPPEPRQPGASPVAPTSAPPGRPGTPPEPDDGGDHTVFMPRLPG